MKVPPHHSLSPFPKKFNVRHRSLQDKQSVKSSLLSFDHISILEENVCIRELFVVRGNY